MLVALDNNCPMWTIQALEKEGHTVVIRARHEPDEVWMDEAVAGGAEVFVSNDLDIANILDRWNVDGAFIELPKRLSGGALVRFIVTSINALEARRIQAAA